MSGASEADDDAVVGRTNWSEVRTIFRAFENSGDDDSEAKGGYAADFVLGVDIDGGKIQTDGSHGIDGIHADGSLPFPTGSPGPGNGIVARGLNGIVGYVHAAPRDKTEEAAAQAGVLGEGGGGAAGVFGRGQTGTVGCEQSTPRNIAFESAQKAGVVGHGETGVAGNGVNGAGIFGQGLPGVQGQCDSGGPGVLANGQTGVVAGGRDGPGLIASSLQDNSGVFEPNKQRAQVWIVPLDGAIDTPTKLLGKAEPGELCVTLGRNQNGRVLAKLWFCTLGGGLASSATWEQIG
jgi:hypothetical protein